MPTSADEALENVLLNGILKDVHDAWERKSLRATLNLIYSGIDALAYLTMPSDHEKVTRSDFIEWCDKYIRFRDADESRTLSLPGLELYAARCAMVHTYGSEAGLHKEGKLKRQIGYGDEFLPEVLAKPDVDNLVIVSIRGLVDAFGEGIYETLKNIADDEPSQKLFAERLMGMVQELPIFPSASFSSPLKP